MECQRVELPTITSEIFEIILQFVEIYEQNADNSNEEWKWAFFDRYPNWIVSLTLAADYLEFDYFLDLCTTRIALLFETTHPHTIQKIFGFIDDFTVEQKQKIIKETAWSDALAPAYLPGSPMPVRHAPLTA
jgi:hypothetical protein